MTFAQIQGNEDVKQALIGMVDAGRIPHAILFHEDDGGGVHCSGFRVLCKVSVQSRPCILCTSQI